MLLECLHEFLQYNEISFLFPLACAKFRGQDTKLLSLIFGMILRHASGFCRNPDTP